MTASEPAGGVGINSYQLEPLELIGIDSNLALYLARSPELRSVACWPSSRRAVSSGSIRTLQDRARNCERASG